MQFLAPEPYSIRPPNKSPMEMVSLVDRTRKRCAALSLIFLVGNVAARVLPA